MQVLKKITEETTELNKQISLLKAEMQTKTREYMKDVFEEFFNTYEDLVDSIFWTQATPFFNDGEECVFGVNEICILLKSDIFEDGEVADYISNYEGSELITSKILKKYKEDLEKVLEWQRDPMKIVEEYRIDYVSKYKRDPFEERRYGKSSAEQMKEWSPSYYTVEELETKILEGEKFVNASGNLANDFSEISDFLGSIDSEILKAVFGDHSKIIVRKDKIEIEEFMHD